MRKLDKILFMIRSNFDHLYSLSVALSPNLVAANNSKYLTVSVGQGSGGGSAGWLWLRASHDDVVEMQRGLQGPVPGWSFARLADCCWVLVTPVRLLEHPHDRAAGLSRARAAGEIRAEVLGAWLWHSHHAVVSPASCWANRSALSDLCVATQGRRHQEMGTTGSFQMAGR